jgi:transcriptional regulator with XRE-family HTH domain
MSFSTQINTDSIAPEQHEIAEKSRASLSTLQGKELPVDTMNASGQRDLFSQRLQQALKGAHYSPDSPTRLAREFNLRFDGRPVTVHAARKWLIGESIPTQEKLCMMASWLGVSTEWLRFGGAQDAQSVDSSDTRLEPADLRLITDLHRLDDHHRQLAREFIRMLVRANGKKESPAAPRLSV